MSAGKKIRTAPLKSSKCQVLSKLLTLRNFRGRGGSPALRDFKGGGAVRVLYLFLKKNYLPGSNPLPRWFGAFFLLLEPYNPSKSARKKVPNSAGGGLTAIWAMAK